MNAWNASTKIMNGIKDGRIRVCDLLGERQKFPRNLIGMALHQSQLGNGSPRPYRPVPEQTAGDWAPSARPNA